jgi:hypothetical protein
MEQYTQDLINILYTGLAHDFDDVKHFLRFMDRNMEYEFSSDVTYGIEGNSFVYYIDGDSLFIAEVTDQYINFLPGENFGMIQENPMLIKETLLSFLIYFKNYDTMDNLDRLEKAVREDSERVRKGLPIKKEKFIIEYPKYNLVDEDSDDISDSSQSEEEEEESESESDEWI